MASHGKKRHIKRLAAPTLVPVHKKAHRYLKKPKAGRHSASASMSLLIFLRDLLGVARDRREAQLILNSKAVSVDGVFITELAFPVGLMDVVSVGSKHYRVIVDKHRFIAALISADAAKSKYCRVIGKKLIRGGKIQLAFHDGRVQLFEKEEDNFKLGDTVKLAIPKQKIASFIKLEQGAKCFVYAGKHKGRVAKITGITAVPGSVSLISLQDDSGDFSTRKDYAFIVDEAFLK
ncbi:hypothetical protein AUJ14_06005 [Candidatus Micrarchaeota archaeon CG1_02_55_22]|nr:MAG: hypothetical protein AUJ14_06005 [Candidatus Micrarchaeota archaeon CG1_02_55_22]